MKTPQIYKQLLLWLSKRSESLENYFPPQEAQALQLHNLKKKISFIQPKNY